MRERVAMRLVVSCTDERADEVLGLLLSTPEGRVAVGVELAACLRSVACSVIRCGADDWPFTVEVFVDE